MEIIPRLAISYFELTPGQKITWVEFRMTPAVGVTGNGNGFDKVIKYRKLKPYSSNEIRVLLLENIHPKATMLLKEAGFQVLE